MTDWTSNLEVPTGVAAPATSPLTSGLTPAAVTPLRTRGELCPQSVASTSISAALAVRNGHAVAAARAAVLDATTVGIDLGIDLAGRSIGLMGEKSALRPQHFGFDTQYVTQYGKPPHHSGTRVRKPPV